MGFWFCRVAEPGRGAGVGGVWEGGGGGRADHASCDAPSGARLRPHPGHINPCPPRLLAPVEYAALTGTYLPCAHPLQWSPPASPAASRWVARPWREAHASMIQACCNLPHVWTAQAHTAQDTSRDAGWARRPPVGGTSPPARRVAMVESLSSVAWCLPQRAGQRGACSNGCMLQCAHHQPP